jgi:uncharacterized protein YxjI
MPILLSCECGKKLRTRDELAGKKIKCPGCGTKLRVPAAEAPAVEPELAWEDDPAAVPPPLPKPAGKPAAALAGSKARPAPREEEDGAPAKPKRDAAEASDLLKRRRFVVKEHGSLMSSKDSYDLLDADTGNMIGQAKAATGWFGMLMGLAVGKEKRPLTIEVRDAGGELVFSVRRSGLIFRKTQLLDARGRVLGRYKAKLISLTGGFNVYNGKGEHVAEIRGKWLKSEYRFLSPDGDEMGLVSKKWGGMARELFTTADTYGVEIAAGHADDTRAKMLILGAAIAIDAMFQKKKGGKGGAAADDDEDEGEAPTSAKRSEE